jgi:uncharacterized membrane protein YhaH (DUF805 family)
MKYYILGLQNYFNISGKSTKTEFWYFFLVQILLSFVILGISIFQLTIAFIIISITPSLSIQFRRINDIGKTRFWATLSLILTTIDLILYFSLIEYPSIFKNLTFIVLGLIKGVAIVLLLVWYFKDSKDASI